VSDNKILDCGGGICLYAAVENIVTGNEANRNDYGIRVEASRSNNVSGNTVTGNWGGLWLISASNSQFKGNKMAGNVQNFGISGSEPAHFAHEFDFTNTVDGKPLYYWTNVKSGIVPADAGCVVLVNCEDVAIKGLQLSKNKDGVVLFGTRNCSVTNNVVTASDSGIVTYNSEGDSIAGNNLNTATGISVNGNGVKILSNTITASSVGINMNGAYNTIADNSIETKSMQSYLMKCDGSYTNITRNRLHGESYTYVTIDGDSNVFYENLMVDSYELRVSSSGNIIARNNVTGITIANGSGNVVCANRIMNGLGLGIGGSNNAYYANQVENNYYVGAEVIGTVARSSNNTVYHNNFVNNKQQVKNFVSNQGNFWDNGTEGNHWSDYNGTDANGDGIGDSPYIIMGEMLNVTLGGIVQVSTGRDNFPLMAPYNINSITFPLLTWEYTMPTPSPTPTPEPTTTLSQTPLLTPSSTATPTPTLPAIETPNPTASPSPSPIITLQTASPHRETRSAVFSVEIVYVTIAVAAIVIVVAAFAIMLKKKNRLA
jgi:parallel beta-helix repeat protein